MNDGFISLLRVPDDVKLRTDDTPLRFEEGEGGAADPRVSFKLTDDSLAVTVHPSDEGIQLIRLRFRGDMSRVDTVMGDSWERCAGDDLLWQVPLPHMLMHWYFYARCGALTHGYGVKTGANCFALWQCDDKGITLWLDVRCGSQGVKPKEAFTAAEIVCRRGSADETPYLAAERFCRLMCPAPVLPRENIFGFNNWYWAYGTTDEAQLVSQAAYVRRLCEGIKTEPFMVMDDGWQAVHTRGVYNGGPWDRCNETFPSGMRGAADRIRAEGCRAGLWFRPLRTMSHIPADAVYRSPSKEYTGLVPDPSHPFTLELVENDARRIADWGYEMIKYDFTTLDLFGRHMPFDARDICFCDTTKTSAQILKGLYSAVQRGAGKAYVLGCNTVGHLTAGIHALQRIGDDTSGRSFEWTRRYGIHSMMRLPQNGTLFNIDPDCSAFTARVPVDENLDFMEATAITGCALFASVTPNFLTPAQEERMSQIYRLAADLRPGEHAEPLDWHRTSAPARYLFRGREYAYDWYRHYDGARTVLTWMN